MGKLLCDSSTVAETLQASPTPAPSPLIPLIKPLEPIDHPINVIDRQVEAAISWEDVSGLEEQPRRVLTRLQTRGVLWKHPNDRDAPPVVLHLSHGGEVSADGNCLFTAAARVLSTKWEARGVDAREMRRRAVGRFLQESGSGRMDEIRNMYAPDLKRGWGVHVVQELKLLAKKSDRVWLDCAIDERVQLGVQRELAAESVYKERCTPVNDGASWAKYMSISGSPDDEYDIITLQYTEEGLLSIDENREGHAAAFGDDIAIECLATEFMREIFVVQAHGSDGMIDEDNCIFFLPHRPRSQICGPPLFLFMKGTGWCGAGADHYEPLIAHQSSFVSPDKVAVVL